METDSKKSPKKSTTPDLPPEDFLAAETKQIVDTLSYLRGKSGLLALRYHEAHLARALHALHRQRRLPYLHGEWHRINNEIRNLVGVRRVIAIISEQDAQNVKYLEGTWRYQSGRIAHQYPNFDVVGGTIKPFQTHSNWRGDRIQVLSGKYRGQLGRTIGLDSTAEILIELDTHHIQLFASEMWWVHRHDHCEATCPVCGESFFFVEVTPELEQLRSELRTLRNEICAL